ncbi:Nucleotide-binding universal stress protein, UspA family [Geodermatophilus amargosae]|uniref:Nucleotide-binding universal stress protein, UspA family n=1 Tax=Geodermatophilus amargosae TaxID=1296565 RepID=A0A1I6X7M2_9ACTN|nr:universal stress protein [Geodermatophilus amargosae]SFT34378.1 Nucleotide-binding universal stress protein, UspA family [Geodermatophilus amargosae]
MTLVVGHPADLEEGGGAHLRLAATLARTGGDDVVVATVTARGFPDPRVDREYRLWVGDLVRSRQGRAAHDLREAGVPEVRTVAVEASSVPAGLVTVVEQVGGTLLVLGREGAVPEHLLHSSPVPLALAARAGSPGQRVTRLTCTWAGTERSRAALAWARRTAVAWDVPLRLVTFAPERDPMLPSETGLHVEREVSTAWARQAQGELERVAADLPGPPDRVVARGSGWPGAVSAAGWADGDLLVVGSSRLGPLARVFLGSTATRILRAAPVPVVVVPRGTEG